jgi:hypothetical protein
MLNVYLGLIVSFVSMLAFLLVNSKEVIHGVRGSKGCLSGLLMGTAVWSLLAVTLIIIFN